VVRDAHRPDGRVRGAGRSTGDHSSLTRKGASRRAGDALGRARRGIDDAGAQPRQPGGPGLRVRDARRVLVALNRPPANYTADRLAALYRDVEDRLTRLPGVRGAGLALYNPHTDNWGEMVLVAGHPPKPEDEVGSSWDRVSAELLAEPRHQAGPRTLFQCCGQ
jgi:hypothetical protein